MQDEYMVEMIGISKAFSGIQALKGVDLKIKRGEIHALVGENGAGKSTLMKILSGACEKDLGDIIIDGIKSRINNSHEGRKAGVGIIYQEFALAPDLTVAENVCMGEELSGSKLLLKRNEMYKKTEKLFKDVGFQINPKEKVQNLSVAYQQMTEIAKTLNHNVKVIVFDEPTAVLAPAEAEQLFDVIKNLKEKGVSVIYISHRMEEIFRLSDRITVLKDGEIVGTVNTKETNVEAVINMMIGRELGSMYPIKDNIPGEKILEVKGLSRNKIVNDVSFCLNQGEILGLSGLVGAGKTEIVRLIFGADMREHGEILIKGKKVNIKCPRDAIRHGICYVPENRKEFGLLLNMSIRINSTLPSLTKYTNFIGIINKKKEISKVNELIKQLNIKTSGMENNVAELSGGNQQKVSLSKWISSDSKIIILDEPTRGVDVGAKVEIYRIIQKLANEGVSIILISSEMIEIIGMSDRVLVIHEGRISGELHSGELTETNIMTLSIGHAI